MSVQKDEEETKTPALNRNSYVIGHDRKQRDEEEVNYYNKVIGDIRPLVDQLNYEPNFLYKESLEEQEARLRASSRFGHL